MPDIIHPAQAGFVKGRQIVDNFCIVQDIVHKYRRRNSPPGCMVKIDIKKAYDSVIWGFLEDMLRALQFPDKFIEWVISLVTSPFFSVNINGTSHGFFPRKKGLRQGDPMSPLLFFLCMEYLSRLLEEVASWKNYKFHSRCNKLRLNHLIFADDLLLFSKGDAHSAMLMFRALSTFSATSGLVANTGKTAVYTCNMDQSDIDHICTSAGFKHERLPFKYLGVNISSKKLSVADGMYFTDKIVARLRT